MASILGVTISSALLGIIGVAAGGVVVGVAFRDQILGALRDSGLPVPNLPPYSPVPPPNDLIFAPHRLTVA